VVWNLFESLKRNLLKAQLFCEVRIDDPFSKKTDGKLKEWKWIIEGGGGGGGGVKREKKMDA
jgi:hypothetical protein